MMKPLILDIDGTLLFAFPQPCALAVKGRRRDSYLARETIRILASLQEKYDLYLATGRSENSSRIISEMMSYEGIIISGMAAENGGVWVDVNGIARYLVSEEWIGATRRAVSVMGNLAQDEFKTCLALLRPEPDDIQRALSVYINAKLQFRLLQDGNKLFVLERNVCKKQALVYGLGTHFTLSAGAGNDLNDLNWLKYINFPMCTDCSKDEVKRAVTRKHGYLSPKNGHDGIQDALNFLHKKSGCF